MAARRLSAQHSVIYLCVEYKMSIRAVTDTSCHRRHSLRQSDRMPVAIDGVLQFLDLRSRRWRSAIASVSIAAGATATLIDLPTVRMSGELTIDWSHPTLAADEIRIDVGGEILTLTAGDMRTVCINKYEDVPTGAIASATAGKPELWINCRHISRGIIRLPVHATGLRIVCYNSDTVAQTHRVAAHIPIVG